MVRVSPMTRETWVQSQVESYQKLKNGTWCYLAKHCLNKRKQSRGWAEMVGVVKWYIQMPTWDTVRHESVSIAAKRDLVSHGESQRVAGRSAEAESYRAANSWPSFEYPTPLAENQKCYVGPYGQEKKKLWVNKGVC